MAWVSVGVAAVGLVSSVIAGNKQRRDAARMSAQARAEREEQNALLEKQKQEYRDIEFTNPYAGMQNQFAEIVYED